MGVVLRKRYILVFTKRWIHLFMLPRREATAAAPIRLAPAARHRWPFRIDSIVFTPRLHHKEQVSGFVDGQVDPIDMFIRFDTFYPWPINLLHHFILPPNHAYSQDGTAIITTTTTTIDDGSSSRADIPYLHRSPIVAKMISSPLRLFTPSDMVIGRHGTVVWLDAMTDASTPSVAADLGQRVMGAILSRLPFPCALDNSTGEAMATPGTGMHTRVLRTTTARAADGSSSSSAPDRDPSWNQCTSMTFHVCPDSDGWNKVAVDDEQGLLAIGGVDGSLTVYDYAPL